MGLVWVSVGRSSGPHHEPHSVYCGLPTFHPQLWACPTARMGTTFHNSIRANNGLPTVGPQGPQRGIFAGITRGMLYLCIYLGTLGILMETRIVCHAISVKSNKSQIIVKEMEETVYLLWPQLHLCDPRRVHHGFGPS